MLIIFFYVNSLIVLLSKVVIFFGESLSLSWEINTQGSQTELVRD